MSGKPRRKEILKFGPECVRDETTWGVEVGVLSGKCEIQSRFGGKYDVNTWIGFTPVSAVYAYVAAINANSIAAVIFFFQGRSSTMQSVIDYDF